MAASTPTASRSRRREPSNSPSLRGTGSASTPQKTGIAHIPSYDSVLLTPSPLKTRAVFYGTDSSTFDDIFMDSPYRSPTFALSSRPEAMRDDEDCAVPLCLSPDSPTPSSAFGPMMPSSSSAALYTPIKSSQSNFDNSLCGSPDSTSLGTKRKSSSSFTPLRQNKLTPLSISREKSFHKLAPLPQPLFSIPRLAGQADHTDTLDKLTLSDFMMDGEDRRPKKSKGPRKSEPATLLRGPAGPSKQFLNRSWGSKADGHDAVVPATAKRRARPRQTSAKEQRESVRHQTSGSPRKVQLCVRPSAPFSLNLSAF